jgi:predicted RNA-binding Zn ribbon-like protein
VPGAIPHTVSRHLCVEFVNSQFGDHTGGGATYDRLLVAEWRNWFGGRCGLTLDHLPRGAALQRLIGLRSLLRRLLESGNEPDKRSVTELNNLLEPATMVWRLTSANRGVDLQLAWQREGWRTAMAAVVVSFAELARDGELDRVRVCANPDCTWMFLDDSRNLSRRFCEARTCGNLVRVRRHRVLRSKRELAGSNAGPQS